MITQYEIDAMHYEQYAAGGFFSTRLWCMWRKSMPRLERIGHAKAAIRLRARVSDEIRKRNLRKIYRKLAEIEAAEIAEIEKRRPPLKIVFCKVGQKL